MVSNTIRQGKARSLPLLMSLASNNRHTLTWHPLRPKRDLATKQDLDQLKVRMNTKFTHIDRNWSMLEQRLVLKFGIMRRALIGILKVLDKLLG